MNRNLKSFYKVASITTCIIAGTVAISTGLVKGMAGRVHNTKKKSKCKESKTCDIDKVDSTKEGTTIPVGKCNDKVEERVAEWICPVCKAKHPLAKTSTYCTTCDICKSEVKINLDYIHTTAIKEKKDCGTCGKCIFYMKGEGHWYHGSDAGHCIHDVADKPALRKPKDVCFNGKFTTFPHPKDRG